MLNNHESATSTVLAWSATATITPDVGDDEAGGDVDEPPDPRSPALSKPAQQPHFQRTSVRRPTDSQPSLLTRALLHQPSDDETTSHYESLERSRRRSMASNVSFTSAADLTSDTGFTSPSRTNTPSPPIPEMAALHLNAGLMEVPRIAVSDEQPVAAPRKKCISFACFARPNEAAPTPQRTPSPATATAPSQGQPPRQTRLKFACPGPRQEVSQKPSAVVPEAKANELPAKRSEQLLAPTPTAPTSPSSRRQRSPMPNTPRAARPQLSRRSSDRPVPKRSKKVVSADSNDLLSDASRFHEFASDEPHQDDWIRNASAASGRRLTIEDTLTMENRIRLLAKEVEDEAEQEEQDEADSNNNDDDDDDGTTIANGDHDDEGDFGSGDGYDSDDDEDDEADDDEDVGDSDGYHTDEETGFAESDEDDEDGLTLWNPGRTLVADASPGIRARSTSLGGHESDSSTSSRMGRRRRRRRSKTPLAVLRPGTPELPDSTDFVCGTLDEDKPMEEAYLSCLAERKMRRTHLIPQDIDPSFPTSEPDDDEDEAAMFNRARRESGDQIWLHGEMDDINHEQERPGRRKSKTAYSPMRRHSPPPKRLHHSPPPKHFVRSPKAHAAGRRSPKRARSPAPLGRQSPQEAGRPMVHFRATAANPCPVHAKSLPRPPALIAQARLGRRAKHVASDRHVRGAIDIVKGLEKKRQRRREKFQQKYCDRARKGQIPERKPVPGVGAGRMRELGLLMAGKVPQGNYVMSI